MSADDIAPRRWHCSTRTGSSTPSGDDLDETKRSVAAPRRAGRAGLRSTVTWSRRSSRTGRRCSSAATGVAGHVLAGGRPRHGRRQRPAGHHAALESDRHRRGAPGRRPATGPTAAPSSPPAARSPPSTAARSARPTTCSSSPGLGLGTIVAEASRISDAHGRSSAARTLADAVTAERLRPARSTRPSGPFGRFPAPSPWRSPVRPSRRARASQRRPRGRRRRRDVVAGVRSLPARHLVSRSGSPTTRPTPRHRSRTSRAGSCASDRFYVRCNFSIPSVDAATWRLEVAGGFDRPRYAGASTSWARCRRSSGR